MIHRMIMTLVVLVVGCLEVQASEPDGFPSGKTGLRLRHHKTNASTFDEEANMGNKDNQTAISVGSAATSKRSYSIAGDIFLAFTAIDSFPRLCHVMPVIHLSIFHNDPTSLREKNGGLRGLASSVSGTVDDLSITLGRQINPTGPTINFLHLNEAISTWVENIFSHSLSNETIQALLEIKAVSEIFFPIILAKASGYSKKAALASALYHTLRLMDDLNQFAIDNSNLLLGVYIAADTVAAISAWGYFLTGNQRMLALSTRSTILRQVPSIGMALSRFYTESYST